MDKPNKIIPGILTGVGLISLTAAIFEAIRNTPKALNKIAKEEAAKGEELTAGEKFKTAAPCYFTTGLLAVAGGTCIIVSDVAQYKQVGTLMAAVTTTEHAYNECKELLDRQSDDIYEYKKAIVEKIGEETEKNIQEEVDKRLVQKDTRELPLLTSSAQLDPDDILCKDLFTGQYFYNNQVKIDAAVNTLNSYKLSGDNITLNDWCDAVGENGTIIGDDILWYSDDTRLIEVTYGSTLTNNGQPCLTVRFAHRSMPRGQIR